MESYTTLSEKETMALGATFSGRLRPGDVVAVSGDLGTGKTRFVQGVCNALGVDGHVASPTFTIINEYRTPRFGVYHIDLYRVNSSAEIRDLGLEEYLSGKGICLIEWAEKAAGFLPAPRYDVFLSFGEGADTRQVRIEEIIEVAA
jgi:tRNA threonylcarbamoyladenosine biosynthesis protein TsaE